MDNEQTLSEIASEYLFYNYDYLYLRAMHERNRTVGTHTIVVGSSHAMNGIDPDFFQEKTGEDLINLSISSQDLFYDLINLVTAIKNGKQQIRRVIINVGYYMLYQDISRSTEVKVRIPTIYYPLFGELHHYEGPLKYNPLGQIQNPSKADYDPEELKAFCERYAEAFFLEHPSYYHEEKLREGSDWIRPSLRSEEEKVAYAASRAAGHNKHIKYTASKEENTKLLQIMTKMLNDMGIVPLFVFFPFSQKYLKNIDPKLISDFSDAFASIDQNFRVWDMNESASMFDEDDFCDASDHLGTEGAKKATSLLCSYLSAHSL